MKSKILLSTTALLTIAASGPTASGAEDFETVKKKLIQTADGLKSLQYKTEQTSDNVMGKSKVRSTHEFQRKGEKVLFRFERWIERPSNFGGRGEKTKIHRIVVGDGEYMYTYTDQDGEKSAIKTKLDPKEEAKMLGPTSDLGHFLGYEFKVLPDETIEGKPCYVMEGTPKGMMTPSMAKKHLVHFDKESTAMVKWVAYNVKGKVTRTRTASDIKINAEIDPDRFVFKAPKGVKITKPMTLGFDPRQSGG